jgi:transposase
VEIVLCNAQHVKNVPGRKTDVKDAQWLAQLMEVGLLRGSFILPPQIAVIRQLCRYRRTLVEERTREGQRLRKVLEDVGIKLDSVASDVLGVSSRAMIRALIDGERDPAVLADLAQRTLRRKIPDLTLALAGRFAQHHGVLCQLHLDHIDHLDAMIGRLDARIAQATAPFADACHRLTSIPGVGEHVARAIIGETGVDMSRFPNRGTPGVLGRAVPGQPRISRQTAQRQNPPRQRAPVHESLWRPPGLPLRQADPGRGRH